MDDIKKLEAAALAADAALKAADAARSALKSAVKLTRDK
jgi:hypothetical protein